MLRRHLESLENRTLFHLELTSAIPNTAVSPGTSVSEINLSNHFDNEDISGTIVRVATDIGNIDFQLFDTGAPITVANFLGYVARGDYNNTVVHRADDNFVVQAGGYKSAVAPLPHIPEQPPIQNEFNANRSNIRGTVAMAKELDKPNSATSEFFINLSDNSNSLDTQNGGYTVFGRVINNTMTVVDAIDGLPKTTVQGLLPDANGQQQLVNLEDFPLFGSTTPSVDSYVGINTISAIPEAGLFNYTVTSSDPELVTPVVENGILRLNYGAGRTGTAEITVTASDENGATAADTFTAGVGVLDVAIGTGGAKAATFTDADGTTATVSLKGGSGTLRFTGSNLSQTNLKSGTVIQGSITDLGINLTGTGVSGALSVRASGGDGVINVNSFTCDAGLKSIAAKSVSLVGNLTVAGNVGKADFADIANSVMSFGGSGGSLALSMRSADTVDIISQIPIKTLKAASFTTGSPDQGVITAPTLGSLQVAGDFTERLNISGVLGSAKIGGAINSFLPWSIAGASGKLIFGSVPEGFVADFHGPIAGLSVAGDFSGDISAVAIKSLAVKGAFSGANLILTGSGSSLGRATVGGAIANSRIQATDSIGSITAGAINASTIFAAVNTDGGILPTSLADFGATPGVITTVTIKGKGGPATFVNANIVGRTIGKLSLGLIQVGNNDVPFGIAADTIASLSASGTAPIKAAKITDSGQSIVQDDFEVRVL